MIITPLKPKVIYIDHPDGGILAEVSGHCIIAINMLCIQIYICATILVCTIFSFNAQFTQPYRIAVLCIHTHLMLCILTYNFKK